MSDMKLLFAAVLMTMSLTIPKAEAAKAIDTEEAENAVETTSYSETIRTSAYAKRADAMAEYNNRCAEAETRVSRPSIQPYILSVTCAKPKDVGGYSESRYIFEGVLTVEFLKPLSFERESISSGLLSNAADARKEWDGYCQNWLKKYKTSPRRVLVEECGNVKVEKLGVKQNGEELWQSISVAVRIFDLKTAYQINHSCYCRESASFKDYVHQKTGRPMRSYFEKFDLMYLNNKGYYENHGSFDIYSDCEDTVAKTPSCQER